MGIETYSTADFRVADSADGYAALERAAARLVNVAEFDGEVTERVGAGTAVATVREAIGRTLGLDIDETGDCASGVTWDNWGRGVIAIGASGEGRQRGIDEVARIFAEEGIDGDIRFEDNDCNQVRIRVADGEVHEDLGTMVYEGDPAPEIWIAQMQRVDTTQMDYVAVVGSESEGTAILAGWVRAEAATLIARGALAADALATARCDAAVLDRWVEIGDGNWKLYQPPA